VLNHGFDRLAGIYRANNDSRMRGREYAKDLIGKALPNVRNLTHIEFNLGKPVEIVKQSFRLGSGYVFPLEELHKDTSFLEPIVVFFRRKLGEYIFEAGSRGNTDLEPNLRSFQIARFGNKYVLATAIPFELQSLRSEYTPIGRQRN
jgi:hypothetical protein